MPKKRLKVVVFYGGDAATNQRNELLAWLRRDSMNVSAKIVSDDVAHTDGAIDTRVDAAIREADKAIAILTPDKRSPPGAPNVIDEIGRWRGKKGGESICIVRQDGVEPYSNHHGLPYVLFKQRIKEGFDQIHDFLLAAVEKPKKRPAAKAATKTTGDGSTTYAGGTGSALIDGRLYTGVTVSQARGQLTVEIADVNGADEGALRALENAHGEIKVTYGNTSAVIRVDDLSFTSAKKVNATLTGRLREDRSNSSLEYSTVIDGRQVSADELATMRASRIISNIPPPSTNRHDFSESLIRGGSFGTTSIDKSPIPEWLENAQRTDRATWEKLRLAISELLYDCGAVGHVERLELQVKRGRLVRVILRATRPKKFVNDKPSTIALDVAVDF